MIDLSLGTKAQQLLIKSLILRFVNGFWLRKSIENSAFSSFEYETKSSIINQKLLTNGFFAVWQKKSKKKIQGHFGDFRCIHIFIVFMYNRFSSHLLENISWKIKDAHKTPLCSQLIFITLLQNRQRVNY